MQLFANLKRDDYEQQMRNNNGFSLLMAEYEAKGVEFFKPSPEAAPWHVQCVIDHGDGEPILINFWPHTGKAQREYCKSIVGWDNARVLLDEALAEAAEDDLYLIED